jgi:hypothetical protein
VCRCCQYQAEEVRAGEWQWSFQPPTGARRTGRVVGEPQWAMTVARRAIEVWHLMNPIDRPNAVWTEYWSRAMSDNKQEHGEPRPRPHQPEL